ncbi:MAG TPA: trigger factor [Gemmatimonadaceae bacterium]|nr:trigger factor [Gemmatimonadaceae bacterium]
MNIEITPKKTDGLDRMIEVRVPVETVRDAEDQAAKRYATSVRLPGFRPGKAPPAMIKKRFKDAIRQQVIESLVQEAFKEVMDRENLKVASQPHVHDLKFEEGQPLSFELHLEIRPELDLARTEGFRITRTPVAVTDDNVRDQVEQIRDQKAAWSPVEDKAAPGDMVRVQLTTADDSGEFPEAREYPLVLGSGQAIPGVEELIMELTPGAHAERTVRWPDDFPDESQRGKAKPVRVTLLDVKRKSLPALDDAFAREVGDFESLEALMATVRKDLEEHASRESEAAVRQQLVDQIAAANPFDIPASWVNQTIDGYTQAYQVPDDDKEQFRTEFRPIAERQVRRDLIIETIAEREGIKASEADIDDRVAEVAGKRGADPGQVYASLQKAGRLREIEQSITEDKVYAWLMARNEIGS